MFYGFWSNIYAFYTFKLIFVLAVNNIDPVSFSFTSGYPVIMQLVEKKASNSFLIR